MPSENKSVQESLGNSGHYSWDPPERQIETDLVVVKSYKAVTRLMGDQLNVKAV